ncbi:hypothetical protein LJF33_00315 [Emcibacteraceae bacterium Y4]|uniref:hypothetical protein n=1 Tax=Pseudemcibacter aquimaris TaxID=2857064 RepID=UPI002011DBA2|nr:hypothetical protein [Pseudemcibacter aquimaris]MCC3859640.1 hypothetical protein [Pseudemcibacter aquimaris]
MDPTYIQVIYFIGFVILPIIILNMRGSNPEITSFIVATLNFVLIYIFDIKFLKEIIENEGMILTFIVTVVGVLCLQLIMAICTYDGKDEM